MSLRTSRVGGHHSPPPPRPGQNKREAEGTLTRNVYAHVSQHAKRGSTAQGNQRFSFTQVPWHTQLPAKDSSLSRQTDACGLPEFPSSLWRQHWTSFMKCCIHGQSQTPCGAESLTCEGPGWGWVGRAQCGVCAPSPIPTALFVTPYHPNRAPISRSYKHLR